MESPPSGPVLVWDGKNWIESTPSARAAAKAAGTFGVDAELDTRPAKPPVTSVDVDTPPSAARASAKAAGTFGKIAEFDTRERRDT